MKTTSLLIHSIPFARPQNNLIEAKESSQPFNPFFFYFFLLLSFIATSFFIINIVTYEQIQAAESIFLIYSLLVLFLMRSNSKILTVLLITLFSIAASIYDSDLFKILLYEEQESLESRLIKERAMALLQICLLFSRHFQANFLNFLINFSLLLSCKYNEFKNKEGRSDIKGIAFFICYTLFYLFILVKLQVDRNINDIIQKNLENSKEFSSFFKKYIKSFSKTPVIILGLCQREFPHKKNKNWLESSSFKSLKNSKFEDLKIFNETEDFLNLFFINKEALELFLIEKIEDLDCFLKDSIVFTKKHEKTERTGDLKEECFKIFNQMKSISFTKKTFPVNILLDTQYKLKQNSENSQFEINCLPILHKGNFHLMLSFENISEKLEIERLKALDAYKDSVLANVCHDLRTPLQGMMTCLEIFEQKSLGDQETLMLDLSKSNISMMSNLIQDILDDNQIKMGKIKLNFGEFKTKEFSQEILNFMKVLSKEKHVEICLKLKELIPTYFYTDQMRVKQVLINLMNNSLKFTPEYGRITLKVSIKDKKPNYLCFEVKDSGYGIPDDLIDKLFTPYNTFQGQNGNNKQGIGLGLTICQNIVSLLGPYNRIFCHSKIGKGTKFWFFVYKEKSQFEDLGKMKSIVNGLSAIDIERNDSLLPFNLYSELRIPTTLKNESIKFLKSEEGSVNEELEYNNNSNSKRMFTIGESDMMFNSPTNLERQKLTKKLVEFDLMSPNNELNKQSTLIKIPLILQGDPKKNSSESPLILRKTLQKKVRANSLLFKPKTYESLPNYSNFRARGVSIGKKFSNNVGSTNFIKKVQFNKFLTPRQIIIVDDDFTCQMALGIMVKKAFENTEVKTFQNGTSAFSYFDSTDNIDLVFTDITMPGMSGDQLALKIKERRKEIVVIGVSGMEPSDNLLKVFDLVLTKPITTAFLKESVERILGKE